MTSKIIASTTAGTALNFTSDTSGALEIQTGAVPTTAMTVSALQAVTYPGSVTFNGTATFAGTPSFPTAVPVASGGTGAITLTANSVLLGNNGSAVQAVAPGTSGNVLTSNGTTWTSATPPAGYVGAAGQVFTGNGTFTIPVSTTRVKVTIVGGGGGGGNTPGGSGAGGGGSAISYLTGLTPSATIAVTVGGGGVAQATGGASIISSGTQAITTVTASGGVGGVTTGTGGAGGAATNGTLNSTGGKGGLGCNGTIQCGGQGGSSLMGVGGAAAIDVAAVGYAGSGFGAGGGGGVNNSGAAGTAGIVIFEW